jgi:hypothetical protein
MPFFTDGKPGVHHPWRKIPIPFLIITVLVIFGISPDPRGALARGIELTTINASTNENPADPQGCQIEQSPPGVPELATIDRPVRNMGSIPFSLDSWLDDAVLQT